MVRSFDHAVTRRVHAFVDEHMRDMRARAVMKGSWVPCKRGCAACCYDRAEIVEPEAVLLADRVRQMPTNVRRQVEAAFVRWQRRARRAQVLTVPDLAEPTRGMREYHLARLACPLLDTNKRECRVYEDRPIACRTHFLINQPPEACAQRAIEATINVFATRDLVLEALGMLFAGQGLLRREDVTAGFLPVMVHLALKQDNKSAT